MSLEQYYTEERIGERLASMLPCSFPDTCVELSAGKGALLTPVIKKWPHIEISTCELDPANNADLKANFCGQHHNVDVISSKFDDIYKNSLSSFDLAICNPPFSWRENLEYEKQALKYFDMDWMCKWSKVRSEIIFTIQNFKLIKNSGVFAVILPELIVFSDSFSKFREHLSRISSIIAISEVETGSFKGTEARTFILVIKKQKSTEPFSLTNKNGEISIHSQNEFHSWTSRTCQRDLFSLADSTFHLKRGRHSGKELRISQISHYHTSGFFDQEGAPPSTLALETQLISGSHPVVASDGDVLINRVGTRALGKAVVVERGHYAVSDCAFRVCVPDYICPYEVRDFWHDNSVEIAASARGTCAQYLTKTDILNNLALFLEKKSALHVDRQRFSIA